MKIKEVMIIIILFIIDIASKYYVANTMDLYDSITIIDGFFNITYAHNTGAAFSILEGSMIFFYITSILGLIFMAYLFKNSKTKFEKFAVLLMIAGTLGNLYDRVVYQYVRDFLDFIIFGWDFAIFNFADTFLVCGVGLFIILTLYQEYFKRGELNG